MFILLNLNIQTFSLKMSKTLMNEKIYINVAFVKILKV